MFKRRNLPKGIRHEVFIRDSYRCTECGVGKEKYSLEVDHIVSISKGGTDEMSNLRTLCEPCNREKSDLVHENNIPNNLNTFSLSKSQILGHENIINCPICNFEFNHPVMMKIHLKDKLIFIDSSGTGEAKIPNENRGVNIAIWFRGECEHSWVIIYQFYKGQTYQKTIELPKDVSEKYLKTIWRD